MHGPVISSFKKAGEFVPAVLFSALTTPWRASPAPAVALLSLQRLSRSHRAGVPRVIWLPLCAGRSFAEASSFARGAAGPGRRSAAAEAGAEPRAPYLCSSRGNSNRDACGKPTSPFNRLHVKRAQGERTGFATDHFQLCRSPFPSLAGVSEPQEMSPGYGRNGYSEDLRARLPGFESQLHTLWLCDRRIGT